MDFPLLQTAAGATYSATHRQYLPAVTVNFGHPTSGNSNATSFVDTSGCDLFGIGTRLQWPAANAGTQTFVMGTQIGDGVRMSGKNGGSIHQSGNIIFRGNVGLYGCFVDGTGNIQFLNGTASSYMKVAGCTISTSGAAGAFVLGNSDNPEFEIRNNTFVSATTGNVVTSADGMVSSGNVLAATAPATFFTSSNQTRLLNRFTLSGAVTVGDIRMNAGGTGWELVDITWSGTSGKPKVVSNGPTLGEGSIDYRTFDVKVVDVNGNPLSGVPVFVTSDYFGNILDDVTETDGNVPFTDVSVGLDNILPVREYYTADAGATTSYQDTVITLIVNSFDGSATPLSNYETKRINLEWPGRDRSATGYEADGGHFLTAICVVQLREGSPVGTPRWTECELL